MQWLIFCPPRLNSYLTTLQIKYNQVSNASCVPTFLRNEPDFTDSRTIESLLTFYRGRTSKKKKGEEEEEEEWRAFRAGSVYREDQRIADDPPTKPN